MVVSNTEVVAFQDVLAVLPMLPQRTRNGRCVSPRDQNYDALASPVGQISYFFAPLHSAWVRFGTALFLIPRFYLAAVYKR